MKTGKKRQALFIAFLCLCSMVYAEVKLPAIFTSNMVMQQQSEANLWGTATPNKTIKVVTSWNNKTYQTKADVQGNWKLAVSTPEAGGPYTITFDDGKKTTIDNILMGELWLCSGQSNMEMPMKGFKNQPIANGNMDILRSKNPNMRLFTVKRTSSLEPLADVTGSWQEATPESVREFSATAYYFGKLLNEQLDVPIGLIVSAWGGSSCETWMAADWLKAFPAAKIPKTEADITSKNRNPTLLYNGMLKPLIGMTMRGVIWYQGEDNYNRASTYADMLATMVEGWRKEWGQGEFPFYYCQIAPYDYSLVTAKDKPVINSAFLREQQALAEHRIPNAGMAVLMDAGLQKCIHPDDKLTPGERLGRLALVKTYGVKGVTAESPYYSGMEIKNDTVVVSFDRAPMWMNTKGTFRSQHFMVAGEDKVFYPAKAWLERSKVLVKSEQVANPVAVRYAFDNYVEGDLYGEDLPVSSFRSDNWAE